MTTFVFFAVATLILTYISIWGIQKICYRYDFLDNPKKYNLSRDPIPYGCGIIFCIVFFCISYFFIDHSYKLYLIWFFGGLITCMSFLDDRRNMSPQIRLCIQIFIGAVIGMTSIKIGYVSNIFGGVIDLHTFFFSLYGVDIYFIPVIFTICWYVFIFNALNWSDGVTGNTSVLSFVCFLIILFLGIKLYMEDGYVQGTQNAIFIIKMACILLCILGVYMYFDFTKKVLMGDAGTMFLGFMLATLAIIAGGKIATVLAVFGLYAVDAGYVVFRRLLHKKNPLKGDFTHLHHRLQDMGLSDIQVVILVGSVSFVFGCLSLFVETQGKIIIFLVICALVIFFSVFGRYIRLYIREKK